MHRVALAFFLLLVPAVSAQAVSAQAVSAQAEPPLPAHLSAAVGLPVAGPARFANVTVEMGSGPWALVGCIASTAGACFATQRVVLSAAERAELVRLWSEVVAMPRCEPAAFVAGDPEYTLDTPTVSYRGHLPAARADIARRTRGECLADARLAWWLAQRMGA